MITHQWTLILTAVYISSTESIPRELLECHDDPALQPPDGMLKYHTFTWLAVVHYVHVTTGSPHMSKAPRLVLIHKQFVLGTANDLAKPPKNHILGNVIFGDYERDELDCGLPISQIRMGIRCQRAYLEIPVASIIVHPEYTRLGMSNSLALAKLIRPLKSLYMLPVCRPSLLERYTLRKRRTVFLLDYLSPLPDKFDADKLIGKKTLKLYTQRECERHWKQMKIDKKHLSTIFCTTGCGMRSGTPIITHSSRGPFELVGIAVDQSICSRRGMRRKLNPDPPVFIDVFPYNQWIINVITAHILPLPYSHNFKVMGIEPRYKFEGLRKRKCQKCGWQGQTFLKGNYCFMPARKDLIFFYTERFNAIADRKTNLHIDLKISVGIEATILCARLKLPNRLSTPEIQGVGRYNLTITFDTDYFPHKFYFILSLYGRNSTKEDLEEWKLEQNQYGFW